MKLTPEDLERLRGLNDRAQILWLEMTGSVETEAHLSELQSIYEEMSRILAKYAGNEYEA